MLKIEFGVTPGEFSCDFFVCKCRERIYYSRDSRPRGYARRLLDAHI